jgi:23S rRNA pseudouridine1911/1915/1917 synthase
MPRSRRNPSRATGAVGILYEDDALVALDKPAGLPAVPIPGVKKTSAWSLLTEYLGSKRQRAFTVHRIDRFTSGVLLFAKTPRDRDILVEQFLAHTPEREYLAVVRGRLEEKSGTLVHYFQRKGMHQQLCHERAAGATRAELDYVVDQPLRGAALVRVTLVTGLQNQIRAQFAAVDHPVVGDRKYKPEEASERRIARVALHASHLTVIHPRSGEECSIDCPPPGDFTALIQSLSYPVRSEKAKAI